jgi:hypothetical protein
MTQNYSSLHDLTEKRLIGERLSSLERKANAIGLQVLEMAGFSVENMQLLAKCDEVQV